MASSPVSSASMLAVSWSPGDLRVVGSISGDSAARIWAQAMSRPARPKETSSPAGAAGGADEFVHRVALGEVVGPGAGHQDLDAADARLVVLEGPGADRFRSQLEFLVVERIAVADAAHRRHGPKVSQRQQVLVVADRGHPQQRAGKPGRAVHDRCGRRRPRAGEQLTRDREPFQDAIDQREAVAGIGPGRLESGRFRGPECGEIGRRDFRCGEQVGPGRGQRREPRGRGQFCQ
jgi:hypothetical protein